MSASWKRTGIAAAVAAAAFTIPASERSAAPVGAGIASADLIAFYPIQEFRPARGAARTPEAAENLLMDFVNKESRNLDSPAVIVFAGKDTAQKLQDGLGGYKGISYDARFIYLDAAAQNSSSFYKDKADQVIVLRKGLPPVEMNVRQAQQDLYLSLSRQYYEFTPDAQTSVDDFLNRMPTVTNDFHLRISHIRSETCKESGGEPREYCDGYNMDPAPLIMVVAGDRPAAREIWETSKFMMTYPFVPPIAVVHVNAETKSEVELRYKDRTMEVRTEELMKSSWRRVTRFVENRELTEQDLQLINEPN